MKINETQRIGAINPYKKQQDAKLQASGKKVKQKDEVHISPEAKELQGTRSTEAASEARRRRVEDLKHAVRTGTYQVEAGKIAEKLLPYIK